MTTEKKKSSATKDKQSGDGLESRPGRDHEPTAEFPPEAQPSGGKGEGRRNAAQRDPGDQRKGARPGKKESRA